MNDDNTTTDQPRKTRLALCDLLENQPHSASESHAMDVAKATGAAESNADPPPVTAKDESNQPNSSLGTLKAAEATTQPPLEDRDPAIEGHDEKGRASAAPEAASSTASAVVGRTLSQEPGK